jgi:colicin import membrane protein
MPAVAERPEFAPPPQPGLVRAFVLAIIAHLLLMLALTWGINWNRESENMAAEAELWSSVPQQAAPPEVQAPPPPPAPAPEPPAPRVAPPPPAPTQADIALEREKVKRELAQRKLEELERQKKLEAKKQREELEREKKLEARKKREELEREKKLEARQKEEALKKQQVAEKKAAEEKLVKATKAKQQQLEQERKLAALRDEQMRRIQGLAGATGGPAATGVAQRSAGPSDSYAGRVRARVRPNVVFTDDIAGNPTAEVEVRMAPDGTITSRRLIKSSGARSWDEAVLRALDKTEVLPRDVDGRVHSPLIIEFRPKG